MSADMSEDEGGPLSVQDWPTGGIPGSPADSAKSDIEMDDKPSTGGTPSAPIQKRRRVTRACDECRRKKIKCDGKQPCTHCNVYSYGTLIGEMDGFFSVVYLRLIEVNNELIE